MKTERKTEGTMYRAPTRRDNGKWAWVRGRMAGPSPALPLLLGDVL